jgi:hypothetical protein
VRAYERAFGRRGVLRAGVPLAESRQGSVSLSDASLLLWMEGRRRGARGWKKPSECAEVFGCKKQRLGRVRRGRVGIA